jgi:hypothetical protein
MIARWRRQATSGSGIIFESSAVLCGECSRYENTEITKTAAQE